MINVFFKSQFSNNILITLSSDEKIEKLIEYFFVKNGRTDLINNYTNKYIFRYNGKNLNDKLDRQIGSIFNGNNPIVNVVETGTFIIKNKFN